MQFNPRLNRWVNDADDIAEAHGSGFEHVNAPLYHVLRRIDPDVVEAACLLQEKSAHAFTMVEVYDDYHRKAIDRGDMSDLALSYYAADTTRWQQKAARAAACARKLIGIE